MGSRIRLLALLVACAPAAAAAQSDFLSERTRGSATAPVTVYEMSDFQCPFCKRFTEQFFPEIEKAYIATGKVRWIYINYPLTSLHPNAVAAAEFAMCAAREGKFWPAHDALFRHQDVWGPLKNPGAFLLSLADTVKVSRARITSCLEKAEMRDLVKRDSDGSVKAGANSTPTFYVEGGLLRGAYPMAVWRPILDSLVAAKSRKP
jgi:protein-disulfide isomerase